MIRPRCPHCLVDLARRSHRGVFHYTCTQCLGFAVHFGGLTKVIDNTSLRALWETAKQANPGQCVCSHCRKPMNVIYAGESSIELDVCGRCNLIWLDTGEWEVLKTTANLSAKVTKDENLEYGRILLQLEEDKRKSAEGGASPVGVGDVESWKLAITILGIPVEKEEDRFAMSPWVTWLTILVCTLVSLMGFRNMEWMLEHFAYRADRPFGAGLFTMITSFFIHGGLFHLVGNMYFLWIFGDNVEDHLGKKKFIYLLATATMMGDLLFRWLHPGVVPLVGASGGISGVITYYIFRFPHRQFVTRIFMRWYSIPAFFLGALFFFKDFLGALVEVTNGGGGVAHLAHLGGAAVGALFAIFLAPERKLRRATL